MMVLPGYANAYVLWFNHNRQKHFVLGSLHYLKVNSIVLETDNKTFIVINFLTMFRSSLKNIIR